VQPQQHSVSSDNALEQEPPSLTAPPYPGVCGDLQGVVGLQDEAGVQTARLPGPAAACGRQHERQNGFQGAANPNRDRATSESTDVFFDDVGLGGQTPPQRDRRAKLGSAVTGRQGATSEGGYPCGEPDRPFPERSP
jgi:hypothetical protein